MIMHFRHLALAWSKSLDDNANEVLRNIDGQVFDWLHHLAVNDSRDNLRTAHHQFIAFAAHHFDQDGKLQLAASHDFKAVRALCFFYADGNVGEQLFIEAFAQIARGYKLALASGKW